MLGLARALGIWLIAAPFALGSFGTSRIPLANDVTLGVARGVLMVDARGLADTCDRDVFHIVCGVWLIVAPFTLQYRAMSRAVADDVAVGIVVLAVSAIGLRGLLRAPIGAV